ncbi:MAG: hypothetical protein ISS45_07390 [Candidatus Omnitrophica bacterium]|nr:hypothetical protein [Candidatus Omnitrophota bacterium]
MLFISECIVRFAYRYNFGIKRLCFYRHDNLKLENIDDIEFLLKNAPFPLEPYTNYGNFIINSRGFRTPEYELKKTPNTVRIINIGDSFVSDCGKLPYPYHFTLVIKNKLKAWLNNEQVEMINLGLPSIGPRFEQKILELEGIRLNPDLIIWYFCIGNDFTDEIPLSSIRKYPIKEQILLKSYFYRLIRNVCILRSHNVNSNAPRVSVSRERKGGIYVGSTEDYDPQKPTFARDTFIKIQMLHMRIFAKETFPWRQWKSIQKTFTEVRDLCKYFDIPLLVVIIPDEIQVNFNLLQEVARRMNKNIDDFQMYYPQTLLTDFFQRNEIEYLDLLPIFRQKGKTAALYTLQDTHFNKEGSLLVAESIFEYLILYKNYLKNI